MRVLVTGGAGFIGSHTCVALADRGHDVTIVDDFSNSHPGVVDRIGDLSGKTPALIQANLSIRSMTAKVFGDVQPDAVIHFAAFKHVPESIERPTDYYRNNIVSLANVVDEAVAHGCDRIVFSSSGSVYGDADLRPIPESAPHRPTNPYSLTKSVGERMVADAAGRWPQLRTVSLRYFNPAGAHPSGLIGEDPAGLLSNLLPVLMHVAVGNRPHIDIFGDDFDTPDGYGVRDYVHVCDVADIHAEMIEQLQHGHDAFNLGRGEGVSVEQMIRSVERITGASIRRNLQPRRPGDVAALYGDTRKLDAQLGGVSYRSLDAIVADAWHWQSKNTQGYRAA